MEGVIPRERGPLSWPWRSASPCESSGLPSPHPASHSAGPAHTGTEGLLQTLPRKAGRNNTKYNNNSLAIPKIFGPLLDDGLKRRTLRALKVCNHLCGVCLSVCISHKTARVMKSCPPWVTTPMKTIVKDTILYLKWKITYLERNIYKWRARTPTCARKKT